MPQLSVSQLKIMQEVITLSVFAPFTVLYMHESLKWNYLWAGLCLLGAVGRGREDALRVRV